MHCRSVLRHQISDDLLEERNLRNLLSIIESSQVVDFRSQHKVSILVQYMIQLKAKTTKPRMKKVTKTKLFMCFCLCSS